MKIIIFPAKKMNQDADSFDCHGLPQLLPQTQRLYQQLCSMSYTELKRLWCCNDQIATLNYERLQKMDLHRNLTPAVISYEGIQYRYLAPSVLTDKELAYLEENLRILSGFYGILRPFDGVTPYRLEMQAKLSVDGCRNLYEFWGDTIAQSLFSETDTIVNLASKEYSRCISNYLPKHIKFLTCIFGELQEDKVVEKGTKCKMMRGEMVRYMAEKQIKHFKELQAFERLGYRFSPQRSDETTYVFLKHNQTDDI